MTAKDIGAGPLSEGETGGGGGTAGRLGAVVVAVRRARRNGRNSGEGLGRAGGSAGGISSRSTRSSSGGLIETTCRGRGLCRSLRGSSDGDNTGSLGKGQPFKFIPNAIVELTTVTVTVAWSQVPTSSPPERPVLAVEVEVALGTDTTV